MRLLTSYLQSCMGAKSFDDIPPFYIEQGPLTLDFNTTLFQAFLKMYRYNSFTDKSKPFTMIMQPAWAYTDRETRSYRVNFLGALFLLVDDPSRLGLVVPDDLGASVQSVATRCATVWDEHRREYSAKVEPMLRCGNTLNVLEGLGVSAQDFSDMRLQNRYKQVQLAMFASTKTGRDELISYLAPPSINPYKQHWIQDSRAPIAYEQHLDPVYGVFDRSSVTEAEGYDATLGRHVQLSIAGLLAQVGITPEGQDYMTYSDITVRYALDSTDHYLRAIGWTVSDEDDFERYSKILAKPAITA